LFDIVSRLVGFTYINSLTTNQTHFALIVIIKIEYWLSAVESNQLQLIRTTTGTSNFLLDQTMADSNIIDPPPFLKIAAGCIACEWCRFNCPVEGCFTFDHLTASFHDETCNECSRCIYVRPIDVIVPLRAVNPRSKLPAIMG
jgi:ferredoxin